MLHLLTNPFFNCIPNGGGRCILRALYISGIYGSRCIVISACRGREECMNVKLDVALVVALLEHAVVEDVRDLGDLPR